MIWRLASHSVIMAPSLYINFLLNYGVVMKNVGAFKKLLLISLLIAVPVLGVAKDGGAGPGGGNGTRSNREQVLIALDLGGIGYQMSSVLTELSGEIQEDGPIAITDAQVLKVAKAILGHPF